MPEESRKEKAKRTLGEVTTKTVRFTVKTVIIIFVIVIIYTIAVMVFGIIRSGVDFLESIATFSVGGFWAFFLGYFGWRLGQTIENYLISMKRK